MLERTSSSLNTTAPVTPLEPFAVSIAEAARLLGRGRKAGGGRSSINEMLARGELDGVKDGRLTLVTMESIKRKHASRPRAVFKPLSPRKHSRRS